VSGACISHGQPVQIPRQVVARASFLANMVEYADHVAVRAAIRIDGLGGRKLIDRLWAWDNYVIEKSLFGCQCFEVVLLLPLFPQQSDCMAFSSPQIKAADTRKMFHR